MQLLKTLDAGVFITLFQVSDSFATTMKRVWKIVGTAEDGRYIVQEKGKRKSYYLNLREDMMVLEGDQPIARDGDFDVINGNGCFNLVAESAEMLKTIIETTALTVLSENIKSNILFYPRALMEGPQAGVLDGQVLYPEIMSDRSVINHLKRKQSKA